MLNRDCTEVLKFTPGKLPKPLQPFWMINEMLVQSTVHTSAPPHHPKVHTAVIEKVEISDGGLPEVYLKGYVLPGQRANYSFQQ